MKYFIINISQKLNEKLKWLAPAQTDTIIKLPLRLELVLSFWTF